MGYVRVPREVYSKDVRASDCCFAPGRYVRFIPSMWNKHCDFAPLDRLALLRNEVTAVQKAGWYRYAEIGDIDVHTGGVRFRRLRGFEVPTERPAIARRGDILISTVRTYRKGIGYVADEGDDLVTTNAILNICGVTDHAPHLTLPYLFSFLRTDFFVEQV